jgi:hypothetical protein
MFRLEQDANHRPAFGVTRRLAAAVVSRVAGLVPEGILVLLDDTGIALAIDHEIVARTAFEPLLDQNGDIRQLAEMTLGNVLSDIQDVVAEELTTPWPAGSAATQLPLPGVRISSTEVRLWYGEETSPALALQPIPLEEIGLRGT